jgi:membrane protease YdiL (CAAX protease family)
MAVGLTLMSHLRPLWLNRHGLQRVPWRLVLFLLLLASTGYGAMYGIAYVLAIAGLSDGSFSIGEGPLTIQILGYLTFILILFGLSAVAVRLLDRRPVAGLGLGLHSRWLGQLGIGLSAGGVLVCAVVAVQMLIGLLRLSPSGADAGILWRVGLLYGIVCIGTASFEELLFRGYLLQALAEGIGDLASCLGMRSAARLGMIAAAILVASPFGLVHYFNTGGTLIGALATGTGGLVLAVAYFRTRSLWLPIGIHTTWNFFLGFVFSLPVSGETMETVPFTVEISGPEWLSGGTFGPEGSLLCFLALAILAVYLLRSRRIDATTDAIDSYPPPDRRGVSSVPGTAT